MAFAQQHRRPQHRQRSSVTSEDAPPLPRSLPETTIQDDIGETNLILSPGAVGRTTTNVVVSNTATTSNTSTSSESETDWHVVTSALPSPSSQRHDYTSPALDPSEPESFSSFHPSDTESFSDLDIPTSSLRNGREPAVEFSSLPFHDGTGTFMQSNNLQHRPVLPSPPPPAAAAVETPQQQEFMLLRDDDLSSPAAFARAMHRMLDNHPSPPVDRTWHAQEIDFVPESSSMPNILLPNGGIAVPSFVNKANNNQQQRRQSNLSTPSFHPTVLNVDSEALSSLEGDEADVSETNSGTYSDHIAYNNAKVARRRRRNLDSIPSHHPSVPGSVASAAVLTTIWDHLRRLATHILENDANTTETLGNLMSEAALDGCLPFNSHLHMDFGSAWLQRHSTPTQYQAIWDS